MPDYCYVVKYKNYLGKTKILKDRVTGSIKEFYSYNSALRLKNWLQDKEYEDVRVELYRA